MNIPDYILLFGSITGVVNSLILIIYTLVTEKGSKKTNLLFGILVLALTMRISKSILLAFAEDYPDLLLALGLAGFLTIGPAFFFFVRSIVQEKFRLKWVHVLHLIPALLYVVFWDQIEVLRSGQFWHLFFRSMFLQYMSYLSISVGLLRHLQYTHASLFRDVSTITLFLMGIWYTDLLNEVAGVPSITAALLYSLFIYFSIVILINKGYIFTLSSPKYAKSGLNRDDAKVLKDRLDELLSNEPVITDNTLSLKKLAKLLESNVHATSQVINESNQQSYYELISSRRIELACRKMLENKSEPVSTIAYSVGYNSLSAFNTAFKKQVGTTPTLFRRNHG